MSVLEERDAYLKSPYFEKHEYGDFTPFYVTVTILTILAVILFVLNIALGCCSRYSGYWNDRHTGKSRALSFQPKNPTYFFDIGNRWIVSLWTATPHNQPALDYTELETISVPNTEVVYEAQAPPQSEVQYLDLRKRESDI